MKIESIKLQADGYETALTRMSKHARDRGYVKETYRGALLERESEFPTGLQMGEDFGLAIPHADPEHVNEAAVLVGVPESPVPFHSMEDPQKTVDAELIVLLIIKDTEGYTQFLSRLVTLFQESDFPHHVREGNIQTIVDLIESNCLSDLGN